MILALLIATALSADDCDNSASARATCDATTVQVATEKRVTRAYEAALQAARHADRDPAWTRSDFADNASYAISLQQSQSAWESFADTRCNFEELEERYGSQHVVLYQRCYATLAKERIEWLNGVTAKYR